ncbi:MAG: MerR family transcriptional regulator [Pseudomonadota bacterium]
MNIGEVAKQLAMPASTIRYYEHEGLLAPVRRVNGKRVFGVDAVVTLRFIQLCQAAGFTIAEIRGLLNDYGPGAGNRLWQSAVATKRAEIKQRMEELAKVDEVLAALSTCECDGIDQCVALAFRDEP